MNKTCTKCGTEHGLDKFCKDKSKPDGLHPWCKDCRSENRRTRYKRNPEVELRRNAQWRKENHERQLFLQRRHYQENKYVYNAKAEARRTRIRCATPPWLTEDQKKQILKQYKLAALLTEATGVPHEVDHIVPLRGQTVSGLHIPENLRVISTDSNRRKSNSFEII